MSEARFTPGPWRIAGKGTIRTEEGWIGHVHWRNRDPNAALIAAAPDLYSALEFAVRELRLVRDGSLHGTPNSVFALIPEAIEKADAALSRARGE